MFLKGKLLFVPTEKLKKLLITIEIQNITFWVNFAFQKNSSRNLIVFNILFIRDYIVLKSLIC